MNVEDKINEINSIIIKLAISQENTTKNVDKLTLDIQKIIDKLNKNNIDLVKIENIDKRVEKIESSIIWISRTIFGSIILAVLSLLKYKI